MARYYVTTPIYYVNDAPHIGHAYTTITADALARWHRLKGEDVMFLTGTDEHGLKVQRSAEANGLSPQEQADRYSARFREAWQLLDISNDDYIRTTEPRHHRAVKALMQAAYDNGWVTLGTYEGLYCVACEAYYVRGRPRGRPVPDPSPAGRAAEGEQLFLPAVGLCRPPCGVVHGKPRPQ